METADALVEPEEVEIGVMHWGGNRYKYAMASVQCFDEQLMPKFRASTLSPVSW
jgi:hypothetical protein